MKRTAENLASQLATEAITVVAEVKRLPEGAPVLDDIALHLRNAVAALRQARNLTMKAPDTAA